MCPVKLQVKLPFCSLRAVLDPLLQRTGLEAAVGSHAVFATYRSYRKFSSANYKIPRLFAMKIPENSLMVAKVSMKTKGAQTLETTFNVEENLDYVSIVFEYKTEKKTKLVRMIRPLKDKFSNTLQRLKSKFIQDSLKAMSLDVPADISVANHDASFSLELLEQTNEEVFYELGIATLDINGKSYRLIRDAPECSMLKLAVNPLVGCPLIASYDMYPGRRPSTHIEFRWYVTSCDLGEQVAESSLEGSLAKGDGNWKLQYIGPFYKPLPEDIGKYVGVVLDLGEDTASRCAVTKRPVTGIPADPLIFEERQVKYCREPCSDGLRVMSYNILADLYLNLRQPQDCLFFPYCPKEYQEYPYRYPLLLREFPGYNADLIFLQEVDERFRMRFLSIYMKEHGYQMYFKKKGFVVSEGLVICFRKNKLRLLEVHDAWLPDLLDQESFPENFDIVNFLERNPDFKKYFLSRPAVIQLLSLKLLSDEKAILLVGNTHLHYHPQQENIKVVQALLCSRHMAHVAQKMQLKFPDIRVYKLLSGDFNSTPDSPVYELLSTGSLSGNHAVWRTGINEEGKACENFGGTVSTFLDPLSSLAFDPSYTNYTCHTRNGVAAGFSGCLDYIWGDPMIKVLRVVPMPSDELVRKYIALPSMISPSDHLPLVCDIQLEKN